MGTTTTIFETENHGSREICEQYWALKEAKPRQTTRSIFGSPKALETDRLLRDYYPFVHPEISICAFVDREKVEHLSTENWHRNYFLTDGSTDFVIAEEDGTPVFCVEYQGGYHQDHAQRVKDAFIQEFAVSRGRNSFV